MSLITSLLSRGYQFWSCFIVVLIVVTSVYILNDKHWSFSLRQITKNHGLKHERSQINATNKMMLPDFLFEERTYSESDFQNERGIVPTFWNESVACSKDSIPTSINKNNLHCRPVWGPCYPPSSTEKLNRNIINRYSHGVVYLEHENQATFKKNQYDWDNLCRPGFLIIGQGKCGTSSLYHYLAEHPRVLPAKEKQIHYFKYYLRRGMRWYLSHFPTTKSMLGQGGLMTGEASPGYLPYPDVSYHVQKDLPGTKIICLGRHPLDRSYSSYRYNYVHPALNELKRGKVSGVERGQTDEYYIEHYLYSFEDMILAELQQLRKCLAPGGMGEVGARNTWGNHSWAQPLYERREAAGLPPLVDLDGQCYGNFINSTVPRDQWSDLVLRKPGKFLNVPNMHLSQAMIGRSLYVYPLEWWYEMFPQRDLYFLCTEEMKDMTGEPINQVGQFLGLHNYNFSQVVQAGAYNVGGHKGYDKVTSWDEVQEDEPTEVFNKNYTLSNNDSDEHELIDLIPLSDEVKTELLEFFQIHNERLFQLIGRRCPWD